MKNKIKARKRSIIIFAITFFLFLIIISYEPKENPTLFFIFSLIFLIIAIIAGISYFVINSKINEEKINEERIKKQSELQQKQQLIDLENQVKKELLKTKLNELQNQSHLYKCDYCNTIFEEKTNFCKYCGAKLTKIDFDNKI